VPTDATQRYSPNSRRRATCCAGTQRPAACPLPRGEVGPGARPGIPGQGLAAAHGVPELRELVVKPYVLL